MTSAGGNISDAWAVDLDSFGGFGVGLASMFLGSGASSAETGAGSSATEACPSAGVAPLS